MKTKSLITISVVAILGNGVSAYAITDQTTGKETTEKSLAPPEAAPTSFLKKAAMAGMAEIALGKLAEQKASSPAVKSFAREMVADHTQANAELAALAKQKGYELPTQLDEKTLATEAELRKLSGAEFDQAYMAQMTKDHDKVVEAFENASKSSTDDDVKAFAAKTLPTLQGHLEQARQTRASLPDKTG